LSGPTANRLTRTEITATGHLTHNKPSHFTNSGDSDASPDGTPSQFLLIRGLEPGVNEELLAKGIAKLYKVSGGTSPSGTGVAKRQGAKVASTTADTNLGAKEGSVKRVLLVKDRHTDESWRYGFAEFASAEVHICGSLDSLYSADALPSRIPRLL